MWNISTFLRVLYLKRELGATETMFGTIRRGITAAPVEGDPGNSESGPKPSSTDIVLVIYTDNH